MAGGGGWWWWWWSPEAEDRLRSGVWLAGESCRMGATEVEVGVTTVDACCCWGGPCCGTRCSGGGSYGLVEGGGGGIGEEDDADADAEAEAKADAEVDGTGEEEAGCVGDDVAATGVGVGVEEDDEGGGGNNGEMGAGGGTDLTRSSELSVDLDLVSLRSEYSGGHSRRTFGTGSERCSCGSMDASGITRTDGSL